MSDMLQSFKNNYTANNIKGTVKTLSWMHIFVVFFVDFVLGSVMATCEEIDELPWF